MLDVAAMLHDLEQDRYVTPRPHPKLVTRRVLVMERVHGFNFDDAVGMRDAGIDTEDVVRTAVGLPWVSFNSASSNSAPVGSRSGIWAAKILLLSTAI